MLNIYKREMHSFLWVAQNQGKKIKRILVHLFSPVSCFHIIFGVHGIWGKAGRRSCQGSGYLTFYLENKQVGRISLIFITRHFSIEERKEVKPNNGLDNIELSFWSRKVMGRKYSPWAYPILRCSRHRIFIIMLIIWTQYHNKSSEGCVYPYARTKYASVCFNKRQSHQS